MKFNFLIMLITILANVRDVSANSLHTKTTNETILRSRISDEYTVIFTIQNNEDNSVTISSTKVTAQSGDIYCAYLLNGAYLNASNQVTLPNNVNTFWYIPFDYENISPPIIVYRSSIAPVCYSCGCIAVNPEGVGCNEPVFDGNCAKCNDGGCCTLYKTDCGEGGNGVKGGGIFIEAISVNFNGVNFQ